MVKRPALRGAVFALAVAWALAMAGCSEQPQEAVSGFTPSPEAVAEHNRGVALMGRFDYEPARQVFAALAQAYPSWLDVKVDLAIATLNRQQDGDEQRALDLAAAVLAVDPGNLRAHYVSGLLLLYLGQPDVALEHFKTVAEADPGDPYASYYYAQCLARQGNHEQALAGYKRSIETDPYLRSAYYGAFQSLQRLQRRDEALALLNDYQRLGSNPRARLVEFKYTRMGPRGSVAPLAPAAAAPARAVKGPLFAEPRRMGLTQSSPEEAGIGAEQILTTADIDGDGRQDLLVAGGGATRVLFAAAGQGFDIDDSHPLAGIAGVNTALWGDFDNDGRLDVYFCRRGPNQLWRQTADGNWEDVGASTGTAGEDLNTVDGAMFDADHDGDLDLFVVNEDGPNELFNNNLDGTFSPLAVRQGIAGNGRPSRSVLVADLDADRDADILVINRTPPHEVYLNDRLWVYEPGPGMDAFLAAPNLAAVHGDVDADGEPEIYTLAPDGALWRWQEGSSGGWAGTPADGLRVSGTSPYLALTDIDGDGTPELLWAGDQAWGVARFEGDHVQSLYSAAGGNYGGGALAAVLMDVAAGPSVVTAGQNELRVWPPGSGRYPFLGITLTGREMPGEPTRSNASGIGAAVAVRVGRTWSRHDGYRADSGPGQSRQPLSVGLGGATKADFVAVDWSSGVFQSELDLKAAEVHTLSETQRQLSSCPVVFAWDGEQYVFVSDVLGVGGMGYAVGPGEYAEPRPWENFLLPEGLLKPRSGRYVLKLGEPMEEAAYLDAARLVAYDLPPGWGIALDERLQVGEPAPSGDAVFFRRELLPLKVVNERSEDVTADVAAVDHRAAPVGALDPRFIGRLRGEHRLTLRFSQPIEAAARPYLVMDGWVEYPYSQTMFAAWQAGADYRAPTIEALHPDGVWKVVLEQFGYPAGMPRRSTVPLTGLPEGVRALRLRTNQEIYWDRLSVVYAESPQDVRREVLQPVAARVAKSGFARRTNGPQKLPRYDYSRRSPFWDTRYMDGFYTRFGPALGLVEDSDDALAVIGPGEEIHLEFRQPAAALPAGWSRNFVFETEGWTKDMDLYTESGETVNPLPSRGRSAAVRDTLHARYNTRFESGR